MARDIAALVASMTLDERAWLTTGHDSWSTNAVERVGIPAVFVTDGPAGARGPRPPGIGPQSPSLNIPCGSALGATWNPELVERLGDAVGDQARTKGCRVLLAPTVNLHRNPLGGRNFESYSEDPLLTGVLAAAFVRGVQSQGVATTVKHLVGNESEHERLTMDSVIDERALRELYLLPFEHAIRGGGSLGVMTSYNRLNGVYNTNNAPLLEGILRGQWGFEGFVVSDWFAAGDTAAAARAGLDLEMPGPPRIYGSALAAAVRAGEVDEWLLTMATTRLLTVLDSIGALDDEPRPALSIDRPEHHRLNRSAAAESMVLLRNDDVLPWRTETIRRLALIGPNAASLRTMGGGSAAVAPHTNRSLLDALRGRLGGDVAIVHESGCDIDKTVPLLTADALGPNGWRVDVFAHADASGDPAATVRRDDGMVIVLTESEPLPDWPMSFHASAELIAAVDGPHRLSMIELGAARLRLDGEIVFDGLSARTGPSGAYFGIGRAEHSTVVDMRAGEPRRLEVDYVSAAPGWLHGAHIGFAPAPSADQLDRAVAAAADADAAILVVGTNNDWESEGYDRSTLALPGDQVALIERVLRANANTVVVVNAGAPVAMDWVDDASAVLQVWFGGEDMADALVDVLVGDSEPSGRLPMTIPRRIEDTSSFGNYPGEHGQVRYGEGVLMGYRWHVARDIPAAFAFGHGLSYTTFDIGPPRPSATSIAGGDEVEVVVTVTNTGDRRGATVVQCYVGACAPTVVRPPVELKAFRKVWLDPGESQDVTLHLGPRALATWDPGNRYRPERIPDASGGSTPTPPAEAGWRITAGDYVIGVGRSVADIDHRVEITVTSDALIAADGSPP